MTHQSNEDGQTSRRSLRGFNIEAFTAARQGRAMTVADLARLADVGQSTIHSWETGEVAPSLQLLVRALAVMRTPIDTVIVIPRNQRYPGDWRAIKGMTHNQLATAAKLATTTLRGIERAENGLTDANADTLAALLGITAKEYRAAYQRARNRPPGTSA